MKKKKKAIKGKKLFIKTDTDWEPYDSFINGFAATETISGTMTFTKAEPVLTIQIIGNTINIDYKP